MSKQPVIFDHDGGIDDLLSLILLLCMPHIELKAVCITPADCYPDDALESTLKILHMFNATNVKVAVGNIIGPNPFPADWRAQPRFCRALPAFLRSHANYAQRVTEPAHQLMSQIISASNVPVTVLMTGPASNLAAAINCSAELKRNIAKVVWMGGAIDVRGNVAMHDHNGTAEWNAYWHPQATYDLLAAELPLVLVPLDATNRLPVSWDFLEKLSALGTPLAELAGQCWAATVTAIPAYEFTYFMWDVLATCVLGIHDDAINIVNGRCMASTRTPNAGQIWQETSGFECKWLSDANAQKVIDYIFCLLQSKNAVNLSIC
ncbi:nucleoside hydrolase [Aestuariibacter sp. GS-14]|uniref:nucleoside hydrolase n=1 Tax=Aestuariibacter sp. GS-14 TaxID=2590670 RepID=UPI00112AC5FE|nr:nucleoside hydrolase [Aestuariibacter sp. GS-14]TPV59726.1 nucleoside hydrolase [Aestuariibacter sp. GS-14]